MPVLLPVMLAVRPRLLLWLAGLTLAVCASALQAQEVQAVPALSSHVIDTTATLSAQQKQALDSKLVAFEAATGAQVVVLMVPGTAPEDIASYANRVGNAWKIGRKDIGDGLILLVAKDERKLRIEVAKTLEGAIPDLMARRVIDQSIAPRFKQGDFAGGIDAGLEQIMGLIRGEALPAPEATSTQRPQAGFQWMDLAVFLFFAVAVGGGMARRALGNKLGSLLTGGVAGGLVLFVTSSLVLAGLAALTALVLTLLSSLNKVGSGHSSSSWGSTGSGGGGWSSGSGGGGVRSGGGGNFGGGGASGGW